VTPCSLVRVYRCCRGTFRLHLQDRMIREGIERPYLYLAVFCLAYSSVLNMETVCFSEAFLNFYQTTLRHIPNDYSLYSHSLQNFKSSRIFVNISGWFLRQCCSYVYQSTRRHFQENNLQNSKQFKEQDVRTSTEFIWSRTRTGRWAVTNAIMDLRVP
jgi:hypothetical protein